MICVFENSVWSQLRTFRQKLFAKNLYAQRILMPYVKIVKINIRIFILSIFKLVINGFLPFFITKNMNSECNFFSEIMFFANMWQSRITIQR